MRNLTIGLVACSCAALVGAMRLPALAEGSASTSVITQPLPPPSRAVPAPLPQPASPVPPAAVPAATTASPLPSAAVPSATTVQAPLPSALPHADPAYMPGAVAAPGNPAATAPSPPAKPKRVVRQLPPNEFALSHDRSPALQPGTFYMTAKAAERYSAIVAAGGWPALPPNVRLGPTSKGAAVATLRLRLSIEGDFTGATDEATWEPDLTDAVRRYQDRLGLKQTGIVAGATLKALNVPAEVRYRQLASTSLRLSGVTFGFDDRYVVVNLPAAAVDAVENGSVVKRYVAVVGDVDHPSPEVQAKVAAINLNPTWTVPVSIIKKEIIPKMRKDPGYLAREKIRILDGKGETVDPSAIDWSGEKAVNYTLRQDSGASNSLGSIRINMPNKFAVYMHDTPSKRLFGADYRFLSHGCVRVSGVYDLAEWLLRGTDGDWTVASMKDAVATTEQKEIKLAKPVPVIWVYLTGWASEDGTVHFRDDVYGIDSVGDEAKQAQAELR